VAECGHKAERGRKRCRDCRRKTSAARPSRTSKRRHGRRGQPVWKCLTPAEWLALWRGQDGKCFICREPIRNRYDAIDREPRLANVDHSHAVERRLLAEGADPVDALRRSVRGLLCYFCNRNTLLALRDDPDRADRAAAYLRRPPAHHILGTCSQC
jgi:recombination endonuclease VII